MYAITNGWNSHFSTLDELRRYMTGFQGVIEQAARPRPGALTDRGEAFVLEFDVPGVSNDNVRLDVTAKGFVLEIAVPGRRQTDLQARRLERSLSPVSQRVEFPVVIDPERVAATLQSGVLTVVFPKGTTPAPRRVPVTTGS
jgi:HSP20 family protein